jgi:hypothetical protein
MPISVPRFRTRPADARRRQALRVHLGAPVFDKEGRFVGYRGVGRHITERTAPNRRYGRARRVSASS